MSASSTRSSPSRAAPDDPAADGRGDADHPPVASPRGVPRDDAAPAAPSASAQGEGGDGDGDRIETKAEGGADAPGPRDDDGGDRPEPGPGKDGGGSWEDAAGSAVRSLAAARPEAREALVAEIARLTAQLSRINDGDDGAKDPAKEDKGRGEGAWR